jgi:hypothetical protein
MLHSFPELKKENSLCGFAVSFISENEVTDYRNSKIMPCQKVTAGVIVDRGILQ